MLVDIVINAALVVLLGTVLGYCVTLNRRLGRLRDAQSQLGGYIDRLNQAISQAGRSIESLKAAGGEAGEALRGEVRSARSLRDELALILASGNNLAERLEGGLMQVRERTTSAGVTSGRGGGPKNLKTMETDLAGSEKRQSLLRALSGVR